MPHTKVCKDKGDGIPETVKTGTEKEKGERVAGKRGRLLRTLTPLNDWCRGSVRLVLLLRRLGRGRSRRHKKALVLRLWLWLGRLVVRRRDGVRCRGEVLCGRRSGRIGCGRKVFPTPISGTPRRRERRVTVGIPLQMRWRKTRSKPIAWRRRGGERWGLRLRWCNRSSPTTAFCQEHFSEKTLIGDAAGVIARHEEALQLKGHVLYLSEVRQKSTQPLWGCDGSQGGGSMGGEGRKGRWWGRPLLNSTPSCSQKEVAQVCLHLPYVFQTWGQIDVYNQSVRHLDLTQIHAQFRHLRCRLSKWNNIYSGNWLWKR